MTSRILLINFTKNEADKLEENLPVSIERGYLGDIAKMEKMEAVIKSYDYDEEEEGRKVDDIDFYFPHPVYEYKTLFINLYNREGIKIEFKERAQKFTEEERKDFTKYWLLRRSPIVIFLGDYQFRDLFSIGIPDINLKKVSKEDITINAIDPERGREMSKFFHKIKTEVILPTHNYIREKSKSIYHQDTSEFKVRYIYWNNNNEDLAIFIEYDKGYSPNDRPIVVILPQFRNNIPVIEGLIQQFAKLYPKYFPGLPSSDWVNSEVYYPKEVTAYNERIQSVIDDVNEKIENLEEEKKTSKKRFQSLRGLLYQSGEELKRNVIDVLQNIFQIKVTDADEKKEGSLLSEDIIIEIDNRKMLAEVKGVKSENPSPIYITQVWKHIHQTKEKDINKGVLILNYDLETDPRDRSLAYKGEYEKELNDIIFIDTRVIFNLALAIIDYGMPISEALAILFQNGRVSFDLDEYIRSKTKHDSDDKIENQ